MIWIYSDIPFLCLPSLTATSVFVPAVCLCSAFLGLSICVFLTVCVSVSRPDIDSLVDWA